MIRHSPFFIKASFDDFRRNKIRTLLTSLGILIGVFAVIILLALGAGLKNYIAGQFQGVGINAVYVFPGKIAVGGSFNSSIPSVTFDEKDLGLLKRLNQAEYVIPIYEKMVKVSSKQKSKYAEVNLTTQDIFPSAPGLKVEAGRFFSKNEVEKRAKVAVIGCKIAQELFATPQAALGQSLRFQDQAALVVGVLAKRGGGFGGPDLDAVSYAPYTSFPALNPAKKFNIFKISAFSSTEIPILKEEIKKSLLKRYQEDDFSVFEQTELLQMVNSIVSTINWVLIAIGSVSLLVGGVGIMNIMYAAVTERIKEIGIRRAIGATQRDILRQFLFEALILSLFGGLVGLLLAFLTTLAVQRFFPAAINLVSVLVAVVVPSVIGIFFGVFPANKAAKLSPIDAIRYE